MPDKYADLTRDQLISLLRRRDASRKLGLVWERDEIEHERDLTEDLALLTLDTGLSRGQGPWQNLLVEGDNFHALRFLTKAFRGQVKHPRYGRALMVHWQDEKEWRTVEFDQASGQNQLDRRFRIEDMKTYG